ncbi:hypothetical protein V2J09_022965 [Rumex salicifolius]
MDTPQKAQIGTPGYNFEESPFSNFINNLSPIEASKNVPISQTLGSLTFTSPPSVFTSPHVNLQRESSFLRRHQVSELAKPDFSSDTDNEDVARKDDGNSAHSPGKALQEVKDVEPSKDEVSADAQCNTLSLTIELPRELKYDCGSPDFRTAPSSRSEMKSDPGASSSVPLFQKALSGESFGAQIATAETDKSGDGSGCDWGSLIDAANLLVFESPQVQEAPKDSEEQSVDEQIELFSSLLSHYPEDDNVNDLEQQHGLNPCSDVPLQRKDQINQPALANKLQHIYQDNIGSSSSNGDGTAQSSKKLENKAILHGGIRRRCLVFEIPGAKKKMDCGPISTSSSSQEEANIMSNSTLSVFRQGGDSPMNICPGIGLHLNTLSVASKGGRVLKPDNLSSEKQLITEPDNLSISLEDLGNAENEVQFADDTSQASAHRITEERRPENTGEGESCKRCNCKKSKCLKLYCECFAAGVYCVEPCACRDCFNKPIHEETVLATRKQIESRNPLAFAPKVIKCSDSVNDNGDDSNKTPASARHKRGCNCKKSNCLKKYCECYQGGVGCSINCRCEGCKNTFGKKDGSTFIGMDLEVEDDPAANENIIGERSLVQSGNHIDEDLNHESRLPNTPLPLFRSSLPLPSSSMGKPPRFLGVTSSSLLNRDGPGRSTFLRTQNKHSQDTTSVDELTSLLHNTSPSDNSIKTLSPNSKRISPPSLNKSPNLRRSSSTSSRKLILQSIPSFPSLTPRR